MFRIFKILDPFYRRFKRRRYWDLKELAEKQGLIEKEEEKYEKSSRPTEKEDDKD